MGDVLRHPALDRDSPTRHEVAGSKGVILVVEDNVLTRCTTAAYLREVGYRIIEAGNAAAAISVLSSGTHVDLVFSDIYMPGELNGHGLAQWAAQHHPEVPVLLTSAAPWEVNVSAERRRDLLVKPYHLADVEHQIEALL